MKSPTGRRNPDQPFAACYSQRTAAMLVGVVVSVTSTGLADPSWAQRPTPDLSRLMRFLDRDRDGALSKSEFQRFGSRLPSSIEPDRFFLQLDRNNDGKLSADEIQSNRQRLGQAQGRPAQSMRESPRDRRSRRDDGGRREGGRPNPGARLSMFDFRSLDSNGDGEIDRDEFAALGETIPRLATENVASFVFSKLDQNNDGGISRAELSQIRKLGSYRQNSDQPYDPIAGPAGRNPLRSLLPGEGDETTHREWTAAELAFFSDKIEPVLAAKCYSCHSDDAGTVRGGLQMDSYRELRQGGASGDVLGNDPSDSLILMALHGEEFSLMPPGGSLPPETIADFEKWISMGAPDARLPDDADHQNIEPTAPIRNTIDYDAGREHWAFQPVRATPAPPDDDWSLTEIDRWLYQSMLEHDLQPTDDAGRATLIRRVTFDLTGLPPTPAEVTAFMDDSRDDSAALADVVDRLLESERFGEHWGRHWLDVARYAESSGKDVNLFYPFAWRYRDYVIDAFNADKPYDEFITEQIAGDLIPAKDEVDRAENLVATGYLAVGPKSHIEGDQRQFLLDLVDEQIDAVSRGVMGITVSCARCHDHKFDPIAQEDYYALAGIFASSETLFGGTRTVQTNRTTGLIELPDLPEIDAGQSMTPSEIESVRRQLEQLTSGSGGMNAGAQAITRIRSANLKSKLAYFDDDGTPRKLAMTVRETQPLDIPIFLRGEMDRPSQIVPRGFPKVIEGLDVPEIHSGSGRLELAKWLTDPRHPLTARVMANRVWMHLMGKALVSSVDNFGSTGTPPSHPELLDHLALEFVAADWSVKSLVRDIVTSRAYRLDSSLTSSNDKRQQSLDPDNAWYWRADRKRLTAESIRDAMLAANDSLDVSGAEGSPVSLFGDGQTRVLDRAGSMMGGSVQSRPGRMSGMMNRYVSQRYAIPSLEPKPDTRSIFVPVIRDRPDAMLDAFDFPDASLVTGKRDATIIASQSLFLMNSEFVLEQADRLAKIVWRSGRTNQQRIEAAYLRTLSRPPRRDEVALAQQFLGDRPSAKTWSAFCQSLLATAEFRHTH